MRKRDGKRGGGKTREERESQSETERDALFESGLLWQHSVSMATIKIGLHAHTYRHR